MYFFCYLLIKLPFFAIDAHYPYLSNWCSLSPFRLPIYCLAFLTLHQYIRDNYLSVVVNGSMKFPKSKHNLIHTRWLFLYHKGWKDKKGKSIKCQQTKQKQTHEKNMTGMCPVFVLKTYHNILRYWRKKSQGQKPLDS